MHLDEFDKLGSSEKPAEIKKWVELARNTHSTRALLSRQMKQFYLRRQLVEYGVKTTVTASMAIALMLGGPPFWIIGGAALMLKISTVILNRFNPSMYVKKPAPDLGAIAGTLPDEGTLALFKKSWHRNKDSELLDQQAKNLHFLQKRIAFALVTGFVIFTILNASVTIAVIAATLVYVVALIDQASKEPIPYVEEEAMLSNLSIK